MISLGGGAVTEERNRLLLKGLGAVVWLHAAPTELHRRIVADHETAAMRPPLSTADALTEISMLLEQRSGWYAELADIEIDTTDRSPAEVAQLILRSLEPTMRRGRRTRRAT